MGAQCVLVTGPGGTGCSTYAAALASSYAGQGRSVLLLGTDPYDDATSMVDPVDGGLLRIASADDVADRADRSMAALLDTVGLDPRLAQEGARLAEAATARLLWAVGAAQTQDQVVVVDAGARGVELTRLAGALPWILQRMAPAQRGWLATSRPLLAAALGARWPGEALSGQVQSGLLQAAAAREVLLGAGSTAIVLAGSAPPDKVRRVVAGLALAGAPVTATIGGARADRDDPPRWRASRAMTGQLADLDKAARTGRVGGVSGERDGDDYLWRMPLPALRFRELGLSMIEDDLILDGLGHRTVITMPTVLRRCRPVDADLRHAVLAVRFAPVVQDEGRDRG